MNFRWVDNSQPLSGAWKQGKAVSKEDIHPPSQLRVGVTSEGGNSGQTQGEDAAWGGEKWQSPDLAEPLRAADIDCNNVLFRFSIIWPLFLQRLINADTLWIL